MARRPEVAARVLDVIFQMRGISEAGVEEDARLRDFATRSLE